MTIDLPLWVELPRKHGPGKRFTLNLNGFRNTHYHTLNKAKEMYVDCVRDAIPIDGSEFPVGPPYRCTYTVYPRDNRKFDLGNVCSILQKFAEDALIKLRVVPDDNYKVFPVIVYQFGEVDKQRPRCELKIEGMG